MLSSTYFIYFTSYYLLPIVHHRIPSTYHLPLLLSSYCIPPTSYCLLSNTYYLLPITDYLRQHLKLQTVEIVIGVALSYLNLHTPRLSFHSHRTSTARALPSSSSRVMAPNHLFSASPYLLSFKGFSRARLGPPQPALRTVVSGHLN